ncbi:hypothetical protein NDU88_000342 [Pleurodeles waltl]|uniref:Uncharacterized protein n=1 Tax=Pleurodeles waltl TaxID=8319 RepID=A0AAV7KLX1_PLEWA|nr:hypothetical protein NDU88_000342 [Pleurodeles waltl]
MQSARIAPARGITLLVGPDLAAEYVQSNFRDGPGNNLYQDSAVSLGYCSASSALVEETFKRPAVPGHMIWERTVLPLRNVSLSTHK